MPVVTLTTDFGSSDHYVAMLKGSLLSKMEGLNIVDVSHDVESHDIVQGAYHLENTYRSFPQGTIHVAAVFNYYQLAFNFVVIQRHGHFFIAPDNGFLSLIFDDIRTDEAYRVEVGNHGDNRLIEIIAHAVGCLSHGLTLKEIGSPMEHINVKIGIQPVILKDQIRATIIHVDHFENVIVNVKRDAFDKVRAGRNFSIFYKQRDPITALHDNYGDVHIGDVLCFFNSAGYLEIAINMGKASSILSLRKNETIQINFH